MLPLSLSALSLFVFVSRVMALNKHDYRYLDTGDKLDADDDGDEQDADWTRS